MERSIAWLIVQTKGTTKIQVQDLARDAIQAAKPALRRMTANDALPAMIMRTLPVRLELAGGPVRKELIFTGLMIIRSSINAMGAIRGAANARWCLIIRLRRLKTSLWRMLKPPVLLAIVATF